MAWKEFYIGNRGPYYMDDSEPEITYPTQMARLEDVGNVVDTTSVSGILKGSGGNVVAAIAGTDYALPFSGLSITVVLAKLTLAGSNGSLTFSNGILTSKVDPT